MFPHIVLPSVVSFATASFAFCWKRRFWNTDASSMDDAKRELVRACLIEARHDLDTARQISGLPDGPLDTAVYRCQRPKAVKGILAYSPARSMAMMDVDGI